MMALLAAIVAAGIALPHCLSLRRADPGPAAALWLASLALRALCAVFLVLYIILFLPSTPLFHALTHWCWETVLPLIAGHSGVEGHRVGDAATVVPGVLLLGSLLSVAFGVARTARAVRRLISHSLGQGPRGSVIVGGREIVLAAAGLARPRVVVTAGALLALEDDELAAGLDHERGHIERRHRWVLLFGQLCRSAGRFVPGGRRALAEVAFHLERDADGWSLSRRNDSLALARAICKAAIGTRTNAALAPLSGTGASERVGQLVGGTRTMGRGSKTALRLLASTMLVVVIAVAALVPPAAAAGAEQLSRGAFAPHCEDERSDGH